ncbi:MAG: hypothetical protein JXA28_06720, partial [Bacteroidetes bacterium]|nr:hypothetical protein [Bacteroidota bacterium]
MRTAMIALTGLFFSVSLLAQPGGKPTQSPPSTETNDQYEFLRINTVSTWFSNNGSMSHNPLTDASGFEWPRGSFRNLLFQEGCLVGGKVGNEVRVSGATYRYGLQAGVITRDGRAADPMNPRYHIYWIRNLDEISFNQLRGTEQNQMYQDFMDWPVEDGAPWVDVDQNGRYEPNFPAWLSGDRSYDHPLFPGDEVIWFVSNDLDAVRTSTLYGSRPMGLEFQVCAWASSGDSLSDNTVFVRHRIINKSTQHITDAYISRWVDPDLGDANDDLVGVDTALAMSFCYNGFLTDDVYDTPPAVGIVMLQTPAVPAPRQKALYDFGWKEGYKNVPLSSFAFYINSDPVYQDPDLGAAEGAGQMYQYMSGHMYDGSNYVDPTTGQIVRFALTGDPVWPNGWVDGLVHDPDDRRMLLSCGPFSFAPGDTQEVVTATTVCDMRQRLLSVEGLRTHAQMLHERYRQNVLKAVVQDVSHDITWTDPDSYTLAVQARVDAGETVSAVLSGPGGSIYASFELYDDGNHGDGKAGDRVFGGMHNHAAFATGVDLSIRIEDAGTQTVNTLAARMLPLAGEVRFTLAGVLSDHLNYDHVANPGENVIPDLRIRNASRKDLGGWVIFPGGDAEQEEVRLDSLAPAQGECGTFVSGSSGRTAFAVQIPADAAGGSHVAVPIRVLNRQYCMYEDTLLLQVEEFLRDPQEGLCRHISGPASGTLGWRVEDAESMKAHRYRISVQGEDWEGKTMTVEDVTDNRTLLSGIPVPDAYAHGIPPFDGIRLHIGSAVDFVAVDQIGNWRTLDYPPVCAFAHPERAWFSLSYTNSVYAFNYGYFRTTQSLFDMVPVSLVFDGQNGQYAYRYLQSGQYHDADYADFVRIPVRAYDMSDSLHPRQLTLGFIEKGGSEGDDGTWLPVGSRY